MKTVSLPYWTDHDELRAYWEATRPPLHTLPEALSQAIHTWQQRPLSRAFPIEGTSQQRREWRDRTREWLIERLSWPMPPHPLEPVVERRCERDGYIEEQVTFVGAPPLRVPATVLIPTRGDGPFPAVLALHDMGCMRVFGRQKLLAFEGEPHYLTQFRQLCYEGVSIMRELVQRGYVVMAIDAMCFGERTCAGMGKSDEFHAQRCGWNDEQADAFTLHIVEKEEPALVRNIMTLGRTWPGLIVADDRRSLDYLASRQEVDADRIGCVGLSFGAYRANYLAALDERIAAAVSVCWTSTMDAVIGYNVRGAMGWFTQVPELFAQMDLPDLQALAAPRPFLAISGWQDLLMRPFGIARAHHRLRQAWSAWEAPERLGSLIYDAPHEFNRTMQQQAWAWLDRWLKR
ncbi:MAG TPA: alpha/beta hydrolase family protein [Phycisphaeraceae bacterium]